MKTVTYVCLLVFLTFLGALGDNVWCFAIGIAGFGLVPLIRN